MRSRRTVTDSPRLIARVLALTALAWLSGCSTVPLPPPAPPLHFPSTQWTVVKEPQQFNCAAEDLCPERACASRSGLTWTLAIHKGLLRIRPARNPASPLLAETPDPSTIKRFESMGWREFGAEQTMLTVGDLQVFSSKGSSTWSRWATEDGQRKGLVAELPAVGFERTTRNGGLLFLGHGGLGGVSESAGEVIFVEDLGSKGLGSYRIARLPGRPLAWSRRRPRYDRWLVLTDRAVVDLDPAARTATTVVDLNALAPNGMIARDDAVYVSMRYFVVEVRGQAPSYRTTWYVRKGCPTRLGHADGCLPCTDPTD